MKFLIDIDKLASLINRADSALGAAMIEDAEAQRQVALSLSARALAISAFEAGYAAALTNVTKILECPLPEREKP